jgi:hypothetical protein
MIITPDYGYDHTPSPYPSREQAPKIFQDTNIFHLRHLSCEVKYQETDDCGFPEGVVTLQHLTSLTGRQASLILQTLRYVILGQFSSLPYRHVLHITITGFLLRIWKFSPTGCRVTTAINYIDDPEPIIRFLMALKRSPVAAIGSDIDVGGIFQVPPPVVTGKCKITARLKSIAKLYKEQSGDENWRVMRKPWNYWLFVPTKDGKDQYKPIEGKSTYEKTLCVFSYPIYFTCSMTSRATRCYLAVERALLLATNFEEIGSLERLKCMHIIKTAWQNPERLSEIEFHSLLMKRQAAENFTDKTYVATVLAGGTILGTKHTRGLTSPSILSPAPRVEPLQQRKSTRDKRKGRQKPTNDSKSEEVTTEIEPEDAPIGDGALEKLCGNEAIERSNEIRELRWVVFEEVGGKLGGCANVGELLQAFIHSINGAQIFVESART